MMKPYLVDVPVCIKIWIRPELQRKQFEVIKKVKPSVLFLCSDGGRTSEESLLIEQSRKMFDSEIDWECTVHKMYESSNLGMYTMGLKNHAWIWSNVDRCIILEDDILPTESFFYYCAELLEKYKNDERISVICGMNHLGISEEVNSDYFFSRQGSIWGFAMWKRTYDRFFDYSYSSDEYVVRKIEDFAKENRLFRKRMNAYGKNKYYEGHVAGSEFFIEFSIYGQNQLQIIPKKNLIKNMGASADSEHSDVIKHMPRGLRRVFDMETYELVFPLSHAKYIIPDFEYEKKRNRIMGYNRPLISFCRKIERFSYKLFSGDIKYIIRRISRKKKYEK